MHTNRHKTTTNLWQQNSSQITRNYPNHSTIIAPICHFVTSSLQPSSSSRPWPLSNCISTFFTLPNFIHQNLFISRIPIQFHFPGNFYFPKMFLGSWIPVILEAAQLMGNIHCVVSPKEVLKLRPFQLKRRRVVKMRVKSKGLLLISTWLLFLLALLLKLIQLHRYNPHTHPFESLCIFLWTFLSRK